MNRQNYIIDRTASFIHGFLIGGIILGMGVEKNMPWYVLMILSVLGVIIAVSVANDDYEEE
jgi:biotin transporter BioY